MPSQLYVVEEIKAPGKNHHITLGHWQLSYMPQLGLKITIEPNMPSMKSTGMHNGNFENIHYMMLRILSSMSMILHWVSVPFPNSLGIQYLARKIHWFTV